MTTLTLLFLALYYKLKEVGNERKARKIYNQYIINEYVDDETDLKLVPPEENLKILYKIIKNKLDDLEEERDRNIVKNFFYFKEKINNYNEEDLENFSVE